MLLRLSLVEGSTDFSRHDVKLSPMPRTDDNGPLKFAFAQRCSLVSAGIMDCKYLAANAGHHDILLRQPALS